MADSKDKPPAQPRWWLNTYFLFAILLALVALIGLFRGSNFIRDPGQPADTGLAWWYLAAAALFFVNGFVSHRATVAIYERSLTENTSA
ncbi:MAG: hypothetical protein H0W86_04530 [Armatimonadetes bacterium]|nr:hypothetical protein [Armatimonadota bacterium]